MHFEKSEQNMLLKTERSECEDDGIAQQDLSQLLNIIFVTNIGKKALGVSVDRHFLGSQLATTLVATISVNIFPPFLLRCLLFS